MKNKIDIAIGRTVASTKWKNERLTWDEIRDRLADSVETNEKLADFMAASKSEQTNIKDVGGYVGGFLRGGRRSKTSVVHRQLLTLDIDFAHLDFWDDFAMLFNCAAVLHSTHKHSELAPRYRLIIPLSREASPDEYIAAGRQLAGQIDIDLFDSTTFETNRLMFWPSHPKDQAPYFKEQGGDFLDVDQLLSSYRDWKDSSQWPTSKTEVARITESASKQADPREKKGVVGAFCRAYTIEDAIETFLASEYSLDDEGGRYTYAKGSSASGLVVYDGRFAFSHHGTDPAGGKLCNSFDLVRLHKFGHKDTGAAAAIPESFKLMEAFAIEDKAVKKLIASETFDAAKYEFKDEHTEQASTKWAEELEIDGKGKFISSANNINLILSQDPHLAGKFRYNQFDDKRYLFESVPWRKISDPEPFRDVDYSGLRNYIESIYGICGNLKIDDSLALEFNKKAFHPVREYLSAQTWDQVPRVNNLLADYFGVKKSPYTEAAIRKMLVGAVARVFRPGIKFDLVLTLVGGQGEFKSMFLDKIGAKWFSDSFATIKGKEAFEQLQGSWLIEMAELSGLRKSAVEAVKHFITKREDMFRPAYGRTVETYPRQCVFFGTTNNKDFLQDPSGNRRFLPIDTNPRHATKKILDMDEAEVGQIWAEAVEMYKNGERLYLNKEEESEAREEQKQHSEVDERTGIIQEYLDRLLPANWDNLDTYARAEFIRSSDEGDTEREFVCVAEVWSECLGKQKEDMDRYKTREINDILRGLEDWEQSKSTKNFKIYGTQKYYHRNKLL